MTPSSDLFQLIQALDKKEKAYFKRNAETGTDMVRLFDLLAGQREFDEKQIREHFPKEALAPLKNYLFHAVLQSLSRLYAGSTVENKLQVKLQEVDQLLRKGLRKAAYKIVRKVKAVALLHNLFLYAIQAIAFERMIARSYEGLIFNEVMNRLSREEIQCWTAYHNLSTYIDLDSRLFHFRRTTIVLRTQKEMQQFADMLRHPLLRSEKKALSFEARYYFHRLNGTCSQILGQSRRSLHHREKQVLLFRELVQPGEEQVLKHSSALYELAVSLRNNDAATEALDTVYQIPKLAEDYPVFMTEKNRSVLFKRAAVLESDFLQYFGRFEDGLSRISAIEKGLKRFAAYIEKDLQMITRYNIAMILYGAGELRKSLRWLNDIINENEQNFAADVVGFCHIMRLVINIDLGRDELVLNLHHSVVSFLAKKNRLYRAEQLFLDFVPEYSNQNNPKVRQTLCASLMQQFTILFRDPIEKNATEYFDFIAWFESRITKRKFGEVYKSRRQVSGKRKVKVKG